MPRKEYYRERRRAKKKQQEEEKQQQEEFKEKERIQKEKKAAANKRYQDKLKGAKMSGRPPATPHRRTDTSTSTTQASPHHASSQPAVDSPMAAVSERSSSSTNADTLTEKSQHESFPETRDGGGSSNAVHSDPPPLARKDPPPGSIKSAPKCTPAKKTPAGTPPHHAMATFVAPEIQGRAIGKKHFAEARNEARKSAKPSIHDDDSPPRKAPTRKSSAPKRANAKMAPNHQQVSCHVVDPTRPLGLSVRNLRGQLTVTEVHSMAQIQGLSTGTSLYSLNGVVIRDFAHFMGIWRRLKEKNKTRATLGVRRRSKEEQVHVERKMPARVQNDVTLKESRKDAMEVAAQTDSSVDSRSTARPSFPSGSSVSSCNKVSRRAMPQRVARRLHNGDMGSSSSDMDDSLLQHYSKDNQKDIGSRVYAEYTNGECYWGTVTKKVKKNAEFLYTVEFPDGDVLEEATEDKIVTQAGYRKLYEENGVLTPSELLLYRCGTCVLCQAADCKKCATCVRNTTRGCKEEVCLQKMCCEITDSRKAQPAVGLPEDWTFVFNQAPGEDSPKLSIFTPKGRVFSSAETARYSLRPFGDGEKMAEDFRRHIGVSSTSPSQCGESTHVPVAAVDVDNGAMNHGNKRERDDCESGAVCKRRGKVYSPKELRQLACKKCILCQKPDCMRCATCVRNQDRADEASREVCLRKMCCGISRESKAQDAVGFPSGWRFVFDVPQEVHWSRLERDPSLHGLVLLAPSGRRYHAVQPAINQHKSALGRHKNLCKKFYAHIGAGDSELDAENAELVFADHQLVGKTFCQRWIDLEGRSKIVYGVVIGCERDDSSPTDEIVAVQYSEASAPLNRVPASGKIAKALALGACKLFAEMKTGGTDVNWGQRCWTWFVPEARQEEPYNIGCGVSLPRLTIIYRSFRLVFTVENSTRLGYGVFVSASPLVKTTDGNGEDAFVMDIGELLDLGVVGPLQIDDKKKRCVFAVKNFIHSFKCEELPFTLQDNEFEFDNTDDITGDVHDVARSHILSYVKGCDSDKVATMQVQKDPEGNLHCLLGVVGGEKLTIPGDGAKREIFVDHGPNYAKARLGTGYSTLPDEVKNEHDAERLTAMASFNMEEIGLCIEFLQRLLKRDGFPEAYVAKLLGEAGERALRVSEIFQETLVKKQESGERVPEALNQSLRSLASHLQRLFGSENP